MNWIIEIVLAHHEAPDQPFWLLLVVATLLAAAAVVAVRRNE